MAISFRIIEPHDLIAVTYSGRMCFEDMRDTASDLSKDPGFAVGHDRIIFLKKDTDFSGMTFEIFRDLKDAMTKVFLKDLELNQLELPAYRVAVVSSPSINQIMMQLFGAIWKADPNPIVAVERFESISDALGWLGRETILESEFRDELIGV